MVHSIDRFESLRRGWGLLAEPRLVQVRVESMVAIVTFDNLARHNAWNLDLETEYFAVLDLLDEQPEVRAIVVTGTGTSFCPGMDMSVLQARSEGDTSKYGSKPRRPLSYPLTVRKPLIAAVNGGCAGIGLFQALLCDLRFVAHEAKMASGSTTLGLPAEFGLSWLLPRLVGHAAATDLLLSGRAVSGEEAAVLGLASRSVPRKDLLDVAVGYAADISARCSPSAMAVVKRQLLLDWASDRAVALSASDRLFALLREGPDFAEGVNAFVGKRRPQFAALPARRHDHVTPVLDTDLESYVP
jgi:enoyl-CoA hydratase/carnithine racemase